MIYNRTFFISDLHLTAKDPQLAEIFKHFLIAKARQTDALYLLGDIFHAWIGDDHNSDFNLKIKIALRDLTTSGVPVYIVSGNHDFLLGKQFIAETGVKILPDPSKINLYDKMTLISHGDIFCTKDKTYWYLHKLIRHPFFKYVLLKMPIKLRLWLACALEKITLKTTAKKNSEIKKIVTEEVLHYLVKYQAEQIIHGHAHHSATKDLGAGNNYYRQIILGDWTEPYVLIYHANHTIEIDNLDARN